MPPPEIVQSTVYRRRQPTPEQPRFEGHVRLFSADSLPGLLAAVRQGAETSGGSMRLAWVSRNAEEDQRQSAGALRVLQAAAAAHTPGSVGAQATVAKPILPRGLHFCPKPIFGEMAFVYTFAAAAYSQMGRRLTLAMPELSAREEPWFKEPAQADPESTGRLDHLEQLRQVFMVAHAHTRLSRDLLQLRPTAAIGLSSGESCALFCLGFWNQPEVMLHEIAASELYTVELGGKLQAVERSWRERGFRGPIHWASFRVLRPLEQVHTALAGESLAHLLIIHSPSDCLIGGEAEACERVMGKLGAMYCIPIEGAIAAHCPELAQFGSAWRKLHRRRLRAVEGVRFYSNGTNASCRLEEDSIADALLRQGLETVDFPATILRAWQDGVRVFVEHGPRGLCGDWIGQILHGREHLAVSLDRMEEPGDWQALDTAAQLAAAGISVDLQALNERMSGSGALSQVAETQTQLGRAEPPRRFERKEERLMRTKETQDPNTLGPGVYRPAKALQEEPAASMLSREQLESVSQGDLSMLAGQLSQWGAGLNRQPCLPAPPLLLIDRVTRVNAGLVPAQCSIFTETDNHRGGWYLLEGHMPAGIMIESGQAHRLLLPYIVKNEDAEILDQGGRVYRLLDAELTFHGALPAVGDTLQWEILNDGYACLHGLHLLSFHAQCCINGRARLTLRNMKASFFSHEQMAGSPGMRWDPWRAPVPSDGPCDPPVIRCARSSFSREQLRAFSLGDALECFGPGFEMTATHNRTPRPQESRLLLLDEVTHFDPAGGPWGRGYLRAVLPVTGESWFFNGHPQGDPHMSTSLLFEGCLQAMGFYLVAMGCTLERDGWRFEPTPEVPMKLSVRGEVTPASKQVVFELYVRSVSTGPIPKLQADLLGSVDGLRALHVRAACQLTPDWLLDRQPELLENYRETKQVAQGGGIVFSYPAILAAAWGKPSEVFGAMYLPYDGGRRIPRLPGPPYHFITRVTRLEGAIIGVPQIGAYAELEYDIPQDAWYFAESASPSIPFCVLLECVLQPCGWLAVYLGCSVKQEHDLLFRNLDGKGIVLREIPPGSKCLTSKLKIIGLSQAGGMSLVHFGVVCEVDGVPVFTLETAFGLFHPDLLKNQAGMPLSASQSAFLEQPSAFTRHLSTRPKRYFSGHLRLPDSKLLMLDRVTGFWPEAGMAGLGRLRGEKDVSPRDWFFKAHFFQDPVQPGSLGVQAMLQLMQVYMLETGMDEGFMRPRFQPIALGTEVTWKYRGQVLPSSKKIVSEVEIVEVGKNGAAAYVMGRGQLYVDGKRIYELTNLAMRIVPGEG